MKLSIILVSFVSLSLSFGSSYAQETKLNIQVNNERLKGVFKQIEFQSEFSFMYDNTVIDVDKQVSINTKDVTIDEVLDQILDKNEIRYQIIDRHIVLIPAVKKSQNRQITGRVTSSEDNGGLPGVNVIVKGTANGTVTDIEGNYSLVVSDDASILVFSSVGYVLEEIEIGTQSVIDVNMSPDVTALDEIVVIGYGTVKKSDLTGSVSQIKTDLLESVPVFNMEQALKVGAAGVRVAQNSGTPGGRIEVRIRGSNSMIGGNQPLYVVDGFPVTGGISYLNPADIEKVDILKDASATAIYGSRGANGVVIITSKRGKQGQKSKIEVNSYFGMQEAVNRYDLLDAREYAIIANEWLKNEGLTPYFQPDQVDSPFL